MEESSETQPGLPQSLSLPFLWDGHTSPGSPPLLSPLGFQQPLPCPGRGAWGAPGVTSAPGLGSQESPVPQGWDPQESLLSQIWDPRNSLFPRFGISRPWDPRNPLSQIWGPQEPLFSQIWDPQESPLTQIWDPEAPPISQIWDPTPPLPQQLLCVTLLTPDLSHSISPCLSWSCWTPALWFHRQMKENKFKN